MTLASSRPDGDPFSFNLSLFTLSRRYHTLRQSLFCTFTILFSTLFRFSTWRLGGELASHVGLFIILLYHFSTFSSFMIVYLRVLARLVYFTDIMIAVDLSAAVLFLFCVSGIRDLFTSKLHRDDLNHDNPRESWLVVVLVWFFLLL